MRELTRNTAERARTILGITTQNLAAQDVVALSFHAYVLLRALLAPDSPSATVVRQLAFAFFVLTVCLMVLTRGEVIRGRRARALTYRLGLVTPMVLSYFEMRALLPALQLELLDGRLYAIDLSLLGTTPALWMQTWNVEPVVEWLSFFYYCHFLILTLMVAPALFVSGGRRLQELMAGGMVIVALGHTLYTLVPGAGPVATLVFDQPLQGAFWWDQVELAVSTAGAQLDIFPSLHTAWPAYFTLHAFAHRESQPFRWLWPVLAFVALNIIVATMFLRWHWFIDVVAGLLLALAARGFAVAIAQREESRGGPRDGRQPVWEQL